MSWRKPSRKEAGTKASKPRRQTRALGGTRPSACGRRCRGRGGRPACRRACNTTPCRARRFPRSYGLHEINRQGMGAGSGAGSCDLWPRSSRHQRTICRKSRDASGAGDVGDGTCRGGSRPERLSRVARLNYSPIFLFSPNLHAFLRVNGAGGTGIAFAQVPTARCMGGLHLIGRCAKVAGCAFYAPRAAKLVGHCGNRSRFGRTGRRRSVTPGGEMSDAGRRP